MDDEDRASSSRRPLSGASSRICASAADVQNIDLMELAGFCRNCLADWYQEAAAAKGIAAQQGRGEGDRLRHGL